MPHDANVRRYELTAEQRARYSERGYLSPLPVFSAAEVAAVRQQFEAFEAHYGAEARRMRTDLHLLQRWAWDVATDARIVDPVTSLLGDDVLLWSVQWFIKEPQDGKFVSLHQDANYWGLEPHNVLTAWIALADAPAATGPMRFVPGSHRGPLFAHDNTFASDNLLSRGQTLVDNSGTVANAETVLAPLAAGEMSLHHVRLIHGSDYNHTTQRRIGMVLRYCATHVRQTKGPDTAVLVAGTDRHHHFDLLRAPVTDFGTAEQARHADAVAKLNQIIMR